MKTITSSVHRILFAIFLMALPFLAAAQDAPVDGTILGARPYEFPAYVDAYGYTRFDGSQDAIEKYWTRDEYEHALTDERFEFQKLLYASDGLSVVAYVVKPVESATPLPTIVFNRGSGVHKDIAPVLMPYMHRLAQEGYVVIAPMYRQTGPYSGRGPTSSLHMLTPTDIRDSTARRMPSKNTGLAVNMNRR